MRLRPTSVTRQSRPVLLTSSNFMRRFRARETVFLT